jgi:uncharacterized OsmC-like protein
MNLFFHSNPVKQGRTSRAVYGASHKIAFYLSNSYDHASMTLAACLDSTIRMIAARLGVSLMSLSVEVVGDVDVRGCLQVAREVPVGFQEMRCHVALKAANGTDQQLVQMLLAASENNCVVFQTLRSGVRITTSPEVSFGAA